MRITYKSPLRDALRSVSLLTGIAVGLILAGCDSATDPATAPALPTEQAIVESMKSDLLRLVPAQEAFWSNNHDYAAAITSWVQVNSNTGQGKVHFVPSQGNVLALTYVDAAGWKATITNPALTNDPKNCGIFVGAYGNLPNPVVTHWGVPGCW